MGSRLVRLTSQSAWGVAMEPLAGESREPLLPIFFANDEQEVSAEDEREEAL